MHLPDPRAPTDNGLIAVGGALTTRTLIEAYSKGIFPWPQEGLPVLWFSPDPRGVLDFSDFHVPESLKKFARKNSHWKFTTNQAFSKVIEECQKLPRPGQDGTWIVPEMLEAYQELFDQGFVISLEAWEDESLVGGIYGVLMNGIFSGESMFYHKDNASKICVWKLVEHLKSLGHTWMDIQMVTPVLESFGGKYISREEFLLRLSL